MEQFGANGNDELKASSQLPSVGNLLDPLSTVIDDKLYVFGGYTIKQDSIKTRITSKQR